MSNQDLTDKASQLIEFGDVPSAATRVSIPNVNLLKKKGSLLYGLGGTNSVTSGGISYLYAKVEALNPPTDATKKYVLRNTSSGELVWTEMADNLTANDPGKPLSAKAGYDIDSKIHISEAEATPGITMGAKASTKYNSSIAIGSNAIEGNDTGFSTILGNSASINGATDCIAIGNGARISQTGTRRYSSIQLGNGTNTTPYSFQVWNTPILVDGKIPFEALSPAKNGDVGLVLSNGQTGYIMSYDGTVVLGPQALATGQEGVAIGAQAVARGTGVAIGGGTVYAFSGGIAIGVGAVAAAKSIAIGDLANTNVNKTIQLGYNGDVDSNGFLKDNETGKYSLRIGRYPLMGNDGKINGNRLNVVKMAFGIFNLTVTVKPGDSSTPQATAYITLSLVYEKSNDNMDVARLKRIISDSTSNRKNFICNGTINFGEAHYLIAEAWVANNKFYFGIPQGTTYEETSTTSSTLNDFGDIYVFNTLDVK